MGKARLGRERRLGKLPSLEIGSTVRRAGVNNLPITAGTPGNPWMDATLLRLDFHDL